MEAFRSQLRPGANAEPVIEVAFAERIFLACGRQPGHYTRFGVTSGWAVTRPELWETKISRSAMLDACIGNAAIDTARVDGRLSVYSVRNACIGSTDAARRAGI
jgi:hypothetical protein